MKRKYRKYKFVIGRIMIFRLLYYILQGKSEIHWSDCIICLIFVTYLLFVWRRRRTIIMSIRSVEVYYIDLIDEKNIFQKCFVTTLKRLQLTANFSWRAVSISFGIQLMHEYVNGMLILFMNWSQFTTCLRAARPTFPPSRDILHGALPQNWSSIEKLYYRD